MTVNELMQILKTLDGNMPVVTAKFETGLDEVRSFQVIDLVMNVNSYISDSTGPHDIPENVEVNGHTLCKALLLGELDPSLTGPREERPTKQVRA